MSTKRPNQAAPAKPAGAPLFHSQPAERGLAEPRRWADANFMRVILHCLVGASLVLVAGCVSDRTRGRSEVCEVHHSGMSKVTLPIEFGLFHPLERERARDAASRTEFPHALTDVPPSGVKVACSESAPRVFLTSRKTSWNWPR